MTLGCGGANRVKVYHAGGTVKIDGKSPGACKIVLQSSSIDAKIPPATANVGDDGKFQLSTYGTNDGIAEGSFTVLVMSDPMKMTPVPTTNELKVDIKRDSSGSIPALDFNLTAVQGSKPTIGAALPNGGGNAPKMPGMMPGGPMMPPAPRR